MIHDAPMQHDDFNLDLEQAVFAAQNPEAARTGPGYFAQAALEKAPATYISTKHNRVGFVEFPKCVTFGKFSGIANSREHEAQLRALHDPNYEPPVTEIDVQVPPAAPTAPAAPVVPHAPAAPVAPQAPQAPRANQPIPNQPIPNTQRTR